MKKIYEVGNEYFRKIIYECELCKGDMWNFIKDENGITMCPDCAFKLNKITENEYLESEWHSINYTELKAIVKDGEIYVTEKKMKFPFEMTDGDYRKTKQYQEWRSKVFERDNFTCQICGQVGHKLNAHHIKAFKDYQELRFDVDNGVTLCEKCHKELHKRLRKNGRQR